jgi:hypothetical protein
MFVLPLMQSGRDFAWSYARQDQLDGCVRAARSKPAETTILVGSERELSPRFHAMATHYLLEPSFARPRTRHDKGGVAC